MRENLLDDHRSFWKTLGISLLIAVPVTLFGVYIGAQALVWDILYYYSIPWRSIAITVILILVSIAYPVYFWWHLVIDLNIVCGYVEKDDHDRSPNYLMVVLFTILTLGIYHYVWVYKQGNRMKRVGTEYGVTVDETGMTYLLWDLLGILLFGCGPLVTMYLMISNMNRLCTAYNLRIQTAGQDRSPVDEPPRDEPSGDESAGASNGNDRTEAYGIGMGGALQCVVGEYAGAEIPLQPGMELVIGRNSEMSQLVLSDMDISRKHCSIRYSPAEQSYYITDFSTYGVYINDGARMPQGIAERYPSGTKLTLGQGSNVFILK